MAPKRWLGCKPFQVASRRLFAAHVHHDQHVAPRTISTLARISTYTSRIMCRQSHDYYRGCGHFGEWTVDHCEYARQNNGVCTRSIIRYTRTPYNAFGQEILYCLDCQHLVPPQPWAFRVLAALGSVIGWLVLHVALFPIYVPWAILTAIPVLGELLEFLRTNSVALIIWAVTSMPHGLYTLFVTWPVVAYPTIRAWGWRGRGNATSVVVREIYFLVMFDLAVFWFLWYNVYSPIIQLTLIPAIIIVYLTTPATLTGPIIATASYYTASLAAGEIIYQLLTWGVLWILTTFFLVFWGIANGIQANPYWRSIADWCYILFVIIWVLRLMGHYLAPTLGRLGSVNTYQPPYADFFEVGNEMDREAEEEAFDEELRLVAVDERLRLAQERRQARMGRAAEEVWHRGEAMELMRSLTPESSSSSGGSNDSNDSKNSKSSSSNDSSSSSSNGSNGSGSSDLSSTIPEGFETPIPQPGLPPGPTNNLQSPSPTDNLNCNGSGSGSGGSDLSSTVPECFETPIPQPDLPPGMFIGMPLPSLPPGTGVVVPKRRQKKVYAPVTDGPASRVRSRHAAEHRGL